MTKTELLNKLAQDSAERLTLARAMDKLEHAQGRAVPAHTCFLSLAEQDAVQRLIAASGHPRHLFWGGFAGAERTVCAFLPDWQEAEDWQDTVDGPLIAIRLFFQEGSGLTHRDFLGSILGLGISREKIGDLLVEDGCCTVILLSEVSHILLSQLEQVGRQRVRVASFPLADLEVPEQQVKQIRDTVATLRLDAVASTGFSLSRSKMADFISSKKVTLNGSACDKPDRMVAQGDVLSCRGLGKCVLTEVIGQSKKGRMMIVIERYC